MNKKLLIATMLTLPLVGCFGNDVEAKQEVVPKKKPTMTSLGFNIKVNLSGRVYIYQHKVSGNCYSWNDFVNGGSISQVVCSDFGILSSDEIKQNSLQEKRNKLELERQNYLKLKQKFDSIDCKSVDEDGDGFYTPCPDVNEFGEIPVIY